MKELILKWKNIYDAIKNVIGACNSSGLFRVKFTDGVLLKFEHP